MTMDGCFSVSTVETCQLVLWLKSTALSQQMITQPWLWPIAETLHFVGLALVIGIAGLFDLRLMGLTRRVSVAAAMDLRGWAAGGVALSLVTGVMFFAGAPEQYLPNPAFWGKLLFLLVAMLNIAFFELRLGKRMLAIGAGEQTPLSCKLAGAVSMASWFLVLYFGRMLPFIGTAF
jgi:hypothetical protein